jgi:hypothetical protein
VSGRNKRSCAGFLVGRLLCRAAELGQCYQLLSKVCGQNNHNSRPHIIFSKNLINVLYKLFQGNANQSQLILILFWCRNISIQNYLFKKVRPLFSPVVRNSEENLSANFSGRTEFMRPHTFSGNFYTSHTNFSKACTTRTNFSKACHTVYIRKLWRTFYIQLNLSAY